MNGRAWQRARAARAVAAGVVGVIGLLGSSACGSGDADALPPAPSTDASDTTVSDSTTTPTTVETTASTATTLSELDVAEAEIGAALEGWWTTPRDTSLGDDGLPIEYMTGPLLRRVREVAEQDTEAGQIMRTRGTAAIRILDLQIDLEAGTAELDVCTLPDGELIDAESGDVVAADGDQAYEGTAFAERVDGQWKMRDFYSTQEGDNPVECDTGSS